MNWPVIGEVLATIYFICAVFNFGTAFAFLDSKYNPGEESRRILDRKDNIIAALVIAAFGIPITILVLMNSDVFLGKYGYGWRLPVPVR